MYSIDLGLHRIGHMAARAPWLALLLIVGLCALAVWGISRIETPSHSLNALFQSKSVEYQRYERMREAFPLNERDVLILVSSPEPFDPTQIEALRELHLELRLLGQTNGVLSLFSVREELGPDGYAPPIVPDFLPEGDEFTELMAKVASHPFVAGKLIGSTPDGGQTLVVVAGMTEEAVNTENLVPTLDAVTDAADKMLADTGLHYELFGVPVMQRAVRFASRSDRLTFNISGFLVGLLMCLVFFRNIKLVLITTLCPAISVLWSFGAFGLVGIELSFFLNAIPPLVMVISFADAMHLTFGIRRRMREGDTTREAVHRTVETVAPACLLATATTSIALLSLLSSDSQVIDDFGIGGAIAVMLVFVVSMLVVPSLSMLMLRNVEKSAPKPRRAAWTTDIGLDAICSALGRFVPRYPTTLAVLGVALAVGFGAIHLSLDPRFRLSEQVPNEMRDRISAAEKVAGFAASSPVYAVIDYPQGEPVTSPRLTELVGDVHDVLAGHDTVGNAWSLALIERQLADATDAALNDYVEALPDNLRHRLQNEDAHLLLVTGHFPDLDATEMRDAVAAIGAELQPLRDANPDVTIELTGASVVSALHATTMIAELNRGLMLAILVVMVLLGVAFRSVTVPLVAFLPNLFPIVASGTLLYVIGFGIDYAGIIALTVAFGLAVDDTIHFIARFQHELSRGTPLEAVTIAIHRIGPVMIITTIVLVCGVGVTVFGQMPQTRIFGAIVIATLFSALAADLFFLPALILVLEKIRSRFSSGLNRERQDA
jgi:predicted RND superfamily exporter protein